MKDYDKDLVEKIAQHLGTREKMFNFRKHEDTINQVLNDAGLTGINSVLIGSDKISDGEKAKLASQSICDLCGIRNQKMVEKIINTHQEGVNQQRTIHNAQDMIASSMQVNAGEMRHPNEWSRVAHRLMKESGLLEKLESGKVSKQDIQKVADFIEENNIALPSEDVENSLIEMLKESKGITYDDAYDKMGREQPATDFRMGWDNHQSSQPSMGMG